MAATLDAGRRGRDLVVVDLPRQLDDAAVIALQAADQAYLVVPAELRAVAAAARVAAAVAPHCPGCRWSSAARRRAGFKAAEVARALDLPLAGTLRAGTGPGRALERGEAPAATAAGHWRRSASR